MLGAGVGRGWRSGKVVSRKRGCLTGALEEEGSDFERGKEGKAGIRWRKMDRDLENLVLWEQTFGSMGPASQKQ